MTETGIFSVFEFVRHEDDAHNFKRCRLTAAPSEMDAMRSAFDSQLVTMTIELPGVPSASRKSVTINIRFQGAGRTPNHLRFAGMVYHVSRRGPRSRMDLRGITEFSGFYSTQSREGLCFLTSEQIVWLHQYADDDTNIIISPSTIPGKLFAFR